MDTLVKCCWRWTVGVTLLQVVLWQKAKVPDHRSALVATLGPGVVGNLLPCHHRQEQPEVSFRGEIGERVTEQFYVNPSSSPLLLWHQWARPPLRPICLKQDT